MDHRSPKKNFRHCLPMTVTMDDNEWVNSEKEACSASFSYWAATGKSTGWNWPLGWKRSNEENRHLPTSFLGLFYPTLKKKLKSETMILGGGPCSQSVRQRGQSCPKGGNTPWCSHLDSLALKNLCVNSHRAVWTRFRRIKSRMVTYWLFVIDASSQQ